MDEEDLDLGEQTGESDDGGAAAASELAAEQHNSSRAVERQRNLEEALLLQMDMQKRLHEQLEVSCLPAGATCSVCLGVQEASTQKGPWQFLECLCGSMRLPPASSAILCSSVALAHQDTSLHCCALHWEPHHPCADPQAHCSPSGSCSSAWRRMDATSPTSSSARACTASCRTPRRGPHWPRWAWRIRPPPQAPLRKLAAAGTKRPPSPPPGVPGLRGSPPLLPSGGHHDQQFLLGEEGGEGALPGLLLDTDLQAAAAVWDEGPKAGLHMGGPMQQVPHTGSPMLPHTHLPQPPFPTHLGQHEHFQGLDELQLPLLQPGPLHPHESQAAPGHVPPGMEIPQQQGQRHGRQTRPPVRLRD